MATSEFDAISLNSINDQVALYQQLMQGVEATEKDLQVRLNPGTSVW